MKKQIVVLALTLLSFNSFAQKDSSGTKTTAGKAEIKKTVANPDSMLDVNLNVEQWQVIIKALGELPAKESGGIINIITAFFFEKYSTPTNKK